MINITAGTSKTIVIVAGQKLVVTGKAVAYLTAGVPIDIFNQQVFDGYTVNTTIIINALNNVTCLLLEPDTDLGIDTSAINFTFSNGTSATTILDTSTAIVDDSAEQVYFIVTAGAGVTESTSVIQAATDSALSVWVNLGTVKFTAAGTAQFASNMPYFGYRLNVVTVAGGSISATLNRGVNTGTLGNVVTNPTLTGIPVSTSNIAAQWAIPVINPTAATPGAAGTFTALGFALQEAYPDCWIYQTAGAFAGIAANGVYYCQMSSTTAGTVYALRLNAGEIPYKATAAQLTAAGTAGAAGTWGASNGADHVLCTIPIYAGTIGPRGVLRITALFESPPSVSASGGLCLGAISSTTADHNIAFGANQQLGYSINYRNRGVENRQISGYQSFPTEDGQVAGVAKRTTIDTSLIQYVSFYGNIGSNTVGGMVLEGATIEILPF